MVYVITAENGYLLRKIIKLILFQIKLVIIDEAHNLISRIVNKLSSAGALSMKIYKYLMDAENCKIILLSGTKLLIIQMKLRYYSIFYVAILNVIIIMFLLVKKCIL